MRKGFFCFFLILVSFIAAYVLCAQILPSDIYPLVTSVLFGGESFEITAADPGASLEIVWIYEADVPLALREHIEDYRHIRDVSFQRLNMIGTWGISDEGLPQSGAVGSGFTLAYPKYSNLAYVFCLKSTGGDIIIRHNYPGGHTYSRIEGSMSDPIPLSSALYSDFAWKIPQWALTILTGALFSIALMLASRRWFSCHPVIKAEAEPEIPVKISPAACFASFLLPVLIALIVCRVNEFVPFGERTFLYNDMLHQYYKFMLYLRNMPAESNDIFYSFSKTLGGNMFSMFSYYLSNPLYLLIFLFPEEQIPLFCSLLIVLHLGLAGLSSFLYLSINRHTSQSALLFSCAYALMAYNAVCAENLQFLTGMVILPIVMLGLERMIMQQKPLLYTLSLAISILLNVYFGYMICLFSLLWFFYTIISNGRKTISDDLLRYLMYSMLAIGLAMVVILPFAASLADGPKSFSLESLKPGIVNTAPELLSKFFTAAFDHEQMEYGAPSLFCGTVTLFFALLFFFQNGRSGKKRVCAAAVLGVFFLSFSISTFYLIWHGLNYPIWWPARFAFTFGFFMAVLAAETFDSIETVSWKQILPPAIIFLISAIITAAAHYPYISNRWLIMDLCILIISGGLLLINRKHKISQTKFFVVFALLLLPDLGVNLSHTWLTNFRETYPKTAMTRGEYDHQIEILSRPIERIKADDQEFYRVEYAMRTGENPGLLYSTNGISHFSSTTGNDIRLFMDRIGFTSRYRLSTNYRYGSTMAMDSLLGIRYLASERNLAVKPYSVVEENEEMIFQFNPEASGLGAIASPLVLADHLSENEVFSNQEIILSAIVGEKVSLFLPVENVTLITENIESENDNTAVIWKKIHPDLPGTLNWSIPVERDDMLYAFFPVLSQTGGMVSVNGERIGKTIDPDNYGIIPLGCFPVGSTVSVRLEFNADSIALLDSVFVYEDSAVYKALFEEQLTPFTSVTKHSSSHLSGRIAAEKENQWLLLTFPYSSEWHFTVNGERVTPEKAFNALTAVPLQRGQNSIEMLYRPRGFLPGVIISILSTGLLVFCRKKTL